MFSKLRLPPFRQGGNWEADAPRVVKWLSDYFLSLEQPGALALPEVQTWTPVLTFATPGDLAVTYSIQAGWVRRIDELVIADFSITTSAFTHTTAAGALEITGLPVTAISDTNYFASGSVTFGGITKAGYTQVNPVVLAGTSLIQFVAGGSGVAAAAVTSADTPTGGSMRLRGTITYAGVVP